MPVLSVMELNRTHTIPRDVTKKITAITVKKYTYPKSKNELDSAISTKEFLSVLPRLRILPMADILPHEETIESKVEVRRVEFSMNELWTRPAIDVASASKKYVDLNGNHRWDGANEAGLILAPALEHDYSKTPIGTFYPVIPEVSLSDIAKFGGIKSSESEARQRLDEKTAYFVAFQPEKGTYHVFECPKQYSSLGLVEFQTKLIKAFGSKELGFIKDEEFNPKTQNGGIILIRNPFTQSDVCSLALQGLRLPAKSTFHKFTYRAHIEISLKSLKGPIREVKEILEEAQQRLDKAINHLQDYLGGFKN